MDTQYVQSFVTVVECGSIAEAARRLNLTAAAIAARVRALEDELGTPLVQRAGRRVKPTQAGLKILERARHVLREVRDMRAIANDETAIGEFRLGVSASVLTGFLPPVLRSFYSSHPKLKVFIEPGTSSLLYPRVLKGELDAAIIVEPQFIIPKSHEWRPLVDEPLIVLAPLEMAARDPLELIGSEPFIRYDRTVWGGRLADRYLRQHNLRPNERLEIDGLMAIATLVAQGLGVSLVPDWAAEWMDRMGLVRLALPRPAPVRRMGLLTPLYSPHAQLVEAFYEEAGKVIGTSRAAPAPA
ncbi:LysR substrate-binding domain-containing protein [Massilia niastensis]|uniref:LysR substrate-binding domain-containing protein n=1 Tax=Massilia niastensis TaxID=544911 RepID=UPI0003A079B9|nr:LysR substrate-binding domain-containing protein [Massilia niastensis]